MIATIWLVVFVIRTSVVLAMGKPRLTVASCVSNIEAYEACVLESISFLRSDLDINIIPIYNEGNIYSASIAANLALEICQDRFLLYVHQDVKFKPSTAKRLATILKNYPKDVAAIGAAGVRDTVHPELLGKWGTNDAPNATVGKVYDQNDDLIWDGSEGFHLVQSIDEVFMLVDRNSGLRFDPSWQGFHLYGLDYCLQARSTGYQVAATNFDIQHCGQYSSSLYQDANFMSRLVKMYKKWGSRFTQLCAPYCQWDNSRIVSYIPFGMKDQYGERIDVPRLSVTVKNEQNW